LVGAIPNQLEAWGTVAAKTTLPFERDNPLINHDEIVMTFEARLAGGRRLFANQKQLPGSWL